MKKSFKIAVRSFSKNGDYTILNVIGLAIGIAVAALILLWVEDEVSFDHQFSKRNVIYRVIENQMYDGGIFTVNVTPGPMASALPAEVTGVKNATRTTGGMSRSLFNYGESSFYEKGYYVDSAFFSIFDFVFLKGNPKNALADLRSIAITARMAKKFFRDADPIGKTLRMDNDELFTVTAVINDPTTNSSFQSDWFLNFNIAVQKYDWLTRWDANGVATFVELYPEANVGDINKQLEGYLKTKVSSNDTECFLFSMNDWHLRNHFTAGKQDNEGQIKYVKLFSAIAAIVLIVACINFMNLATARSSTRAREVGVRKVLGARRGNLIFQFITEATGLAFASVIIAIVIVYLSLPGFNLLVGKSLALDLLDPVHVSLLILITIFCGLIAGSYPAFYLSGFNPVNTLKGLKASNTSGVIFIRKGLVTVQFVVSIILVIATIVIYQQVHFTKNRSLGYDTSQILYMDVRGTVTEHFQTIKNELLQTGKVENAALSMNPVVQLGWYSSDNFKWQGKLEDQKVLITTEGVTPDYIETMGMSIVEGRNFNEDQKADTNNIIINETLAHIISEKSPVGSTIHAEDRALKVIGVVRDFVFGNMYSKKPEPVILSSNPAPYGYMSIRLEKSKATPETITAIEQIMKRHNPQYPFEYTFLNDEFDRFFKTEILMEQLSGVFGILTVFISCLGLFGLAAYTAERRSKEIGIRKALGASVNGITQLITFEFVKLAAISIVIAFPVAWFIMKNWLETFEFRTPIYWWVFSAVGLGTILVTTLTVGFKTLKAAMINPTEVLRRE